MAAWAAKSVAAGVHSGAEVTTMDTVGRLFIGSLLAVAGVSKLLDLDTFRKLLRQLCMGHRGCAQLLGGAIPVVEILLGVALIAHIRPTFVAYSSALLFCLFGGVVTMHLASGHPSLSCGCFGGFSGRSYLGWSLVIRNAGLAVVAFGLGGHSTGIYVTVGLGILTSGLAAQRIVSRHDATISRPVRHSSQLG